VWPDEKAGNASRSCHTVQESRRAADMVVEDILATDFFAPTHGAGGCSNSNTEVLIPTRRGRGLGRRGPTEVAETCRGEWRRIRSPRDTTGSCHGEITLKKASRRAPARNFCGNAEADATATAFDPRPGSRPPWRAPQGRTERWCRPFFRQPRKQAPQRPALA